MCGDCNVLDFSSVMADDYEYIQHPECQRRHSHKVHGPDTLLVIGQKCSPRLSSLFAWWHSDVRNVFGDSLGTGNVGEPEINELIVDSLGTPQRILLMNPFDGINDIFGKGRTTLGSGLAFPIQTKCSIVPTDDCVRLEYNKG